jgi:hypothetical protein
MEQTRPLWKSILKWFGLCTVAQVIGGGTQGFFGLHANDGAMISLGVLVAMILWHHRTRLITQEGYFMNTLRAIGLRILFALLSLVMAVVVVAVALLFGWRMTDREAFGTCAVLFIVGGIAVKLLQKRGPTVAQPISEPPAPRQTTRLTLAYRLGRMFAKEAR